MAKKTLYDYKNVFGRAPEPVIGSFSLDGVPSNVHSKRVFGNYRLASTPCLDDNQNPLEGTKLYGMTEKNPTIGVKLPKRLEPESVLHTWDQRNAFDWGRYND